MSAVAAMTMCVRRGRSAASTRPPVRWDLPAPCKVRSTAGPSRRLVRECPIRPRRRRCQIRAEARLLRRRSARSAGRLPDRRSCRPRGDGPNIGRIFDARSVIHRNGRRSWPDNAAVARRRHGWCRSPAAFARQCVAYRVPEWPRAPAGVDVESALFGIKLKNGLEHHASEFIEGEETRLNAAFQALNDQYSTGL